jgi:hypothetical protein
VRALKSTSRKIRMKTNAAPDPACLGFAPLEIHDLAVIFVRLIHATQFHSHSVQLQRRAHPAARLALAKNICHRREIDQMDAAFVPRHVPIVRVSKDAGFEMLSRKILMENKNPLGSGFLWTQLDVSG